MNIYDYKNKSYSNYQPTVSRGANYKSTYLDEECLKGGSRGQRAKREGEPDGVSQTPVRGRREMFRIESKLYDSKDVDLQAEKDLSPIRAAGAAAAAAGLGREWSTSVMSPDHHNRSVSTTSNNNGYQTDRGDSYNRSSHQQAPGTSQNHSQHEPSGEKNNRTVSVSTNYDTLDRSGFGGPPTNGEVNHSILSNRNHADLNNRSVPSAKNSTSVDQSVLSNRSDLNDLNKSALSHHNDLNRSAVSSRTAYGEPNRSILSNRGTVLSYRQASVDRTSSNDRTPGEHQGDLNRSAASRDYDQSLTSSLTRDHSRTPTHKQNGFAKPVREVPLDQSQRSLNLSRGSLTSPRVVSSSSVQAALVNISFICILSLILVVVAMQLLFRLSGRRAEGGALRGSVLSNESYASTGEVAVAVASVVVMLDLCCLMVCSMQTVFAAKLLRCSQGHERAYKYIKECASTRFIAVTGFFISIPFLLLAILLYLLMEFRSTAAIISVVIMTVGIIFILLAISHSTYYWRSEKNRADRQLPVYDGRSIINGIAEGNGLELSTLV